MYHFYLGADRFMLPFKVVVAVAIAETEAECGVDEMATGGFELWSRPLVVCTILTKTLSIRVRIVRVQKPAF